MPRTKTKAKTSDPRPAVAIGHVEHRVASVAKSAKFLESIGMRPIHRSRDFAVMELRGGTHIILAKAKAKIAKGADAPFDLIVDDVDETRRACAKLSLKPSRMSRGSIHDWFALEDPSGYQITILSSHAGNRAV
jgi:catechol-2,3-dioxygenase